MNSQLKFHNCRGFQFQLFAWASQWIVSQIHRGTEPWSPWPQTRLFIFEAADVMGYITTITILAPYTFSFQKWPEEHEYFVDWPCLHQMKSSEPFKSYSSNMLMTTDWTSWQWLPPKIMRYFNFSCWLFFGGQFSWFTWPTQNDFVFWRKNIVVY